MVQRMATWKTTEATTSDDYYDRLLMTVMMEAAAAASTVPSPGGDANCTGSDNVGSNYISSSSSSSSSNSNSSNSSRSSTCSTTFNNNNTVGSDSSDVHGGGDDISDMCFKIEVDDEDYDECDDAATTTAADDDVDGGNESDTPDTMVKFQLRQLVKSTAACCSTTAALLEPENKTLAATAVAVTPSGSTSSSQHIHLWQFLKELLTASSAAAELQTTTADGDTAHCASPPSPSATSTALSSTAANKPHQPQQMIRWLDRKLGVFKIEDSQAVARLWGRRKNRPAMNYDKLSRSLRQYYKKGIMRKTERSQRLVYQFCHPYNA